MRAAHAHGFGQRLGMKGPAALVDVLAVGGDPERHHAGPELLEHLGGDLVGGPVPAIDRHRKAVEREMPREGGLHEDVVPPDRVVDAKRLADLRGRRPQRVDRVGEHQPFDLSLDLVGQLEALAVEELDAVVLKRVVRGGDHHARIGPQRAREEGDARGGQRPHEQHVDAHRADARGHGRLEHVAREPRVLADQDLVPVRRALAHVRERPAEPQRRLRGHRLDVRDAPHAVGAEEASPAHDSPPAVASVSCTSGGSPTSSTPAGSSTCTGSVCRPGPSPAASTATAPSASLKLLSSR